MSKKNGTRRSHNTTVKSRCCGFKAPPILGLLSDLVDKIVLPTPTQPFTAWLFPPNSCQQLLLANKQPDTIALIISGLDIRQTSVLD